VAGALLAVNDALLKQAFPGWWTGKLSDLAGVFIVAVVLGLATRRPWTADLLTGAGFVALKLSPTVAALAAPLLGGVTRTDATDLLALVALLPAHRFVAHHVEPRTEGRPWQVPLSAAAISLTVLSVSATSCAYPPDGISSFAVDGDQILAFTPAAELDDDQHDVEDATSTEGRGSTTSTRPRIVEAYRSGDGGTSWEEIDPPRRVGDPLGREVSGPDACREDGTCFRTTRDDGGPLGAVEVREPDGTWQVTSTLSDEELRRIELQTVRCGRDDVGQGFFESVAIVDGPRGEHVLVAMGDEGALHLEPGGSDWERVAVGPYEPASLLFPSWFDALGWYGFVLLVAALAGTLVFLCLRWRTHATSAALAVLAIGIGLGLFATLWFLLEVGAGSYAAKGTILVLISIATVVCSVLLARTPDRDRKSRRSATAEPPFRR
jgi:hypothetical protein